MRIFVGLGALSCFMGVVAGALGSHALKELIIRMGGVNNFNIATDYMFYHGLALMAVGMLKQRFPNTSFQYAGWLFVTGTILFQGNLYLIAIGGIRTMQALTPVGGICLMLGWIVLGIMAARIKAD
jgi:uncharacterized membrane protein YgdD (TMEM256/DUF423 family)